MDNHIWDRMVDNALAHKQQAGAASNIVAFTARKAALQPYKKYAALAACLCLLALAGVLYPDAVQIPTAQPMQQAAIEAETFDDMVIYDLLDNLS